MFLDGLNIFDLYFSAVDILNPLGIMSVLDNQNAHCGTSAEKQAKEVRRGETSGKSELKVEAFLSTSSPPKFRKTVVSHH